MPLTLGLINQWFQILRIAGGENDSVNTTRHEFLENLNISLAKVLNGAVDEFNTGPRSALFLFLHSAP